MDRPSGDKFIESRDLEGCDQHATHHVGLVDEDAHRILGHQKLLREAAALVVVAGMEGALTSVVG